MNELRPLFRQLARAGFILLPEPGLEAPLIRHGRLLRFDPEAPVEEVALRLSSLIPGGCTQG
jgi:hypothetical protein